MRHFLTFIHRNKASIGTTIISNNKSGKKRISMKEYEVMGARKGKGEKGNRNTFFLKDY